MPNWRRARLATNHANQRPQHDRGQCAGPAGAAEGAARRHRQAQGAKPALKRRSASAPDSWRIGGQRPCRLAPDSREPATTACIAGSVRCASTRSTTRRSFGEVAPALPGQPATAACFAGQFEQALRAALSSIASPPAEPDDCQHARGRPSRAGHRADGDRRHRRMRAPTNSLAARSAAVMLPWSKGSPLAGRPSASVSQPIISSAGIEAEAQAIFGPRGAVADRFHRQPFEARAGGHARIDLLLRQLARTAVETRRTWSRQYHMAARGESH